MDAKTPDNLATPSDVLTPAYAKKGIDTSWYKGRELTEEERETFRQRSRKSQIARLNADKGLGPEPIHPLFSARLDPNELMPLIKPNGLVSLSLFSGGGGLDLGFERAGFAHASSWDILPFAGTALTENRRHWDVRSGAEGDVTKMDWSTYRGKVDVIQGGPPCQPFSTAGHQRGSSDVRDMFPEFIRAVTEIQPKAFVAENVTGILAKKFENYLRTVVLGALSKGYYLSTFLLDAVDFGVPQRRKRFFIVGFQKEEHASIYRQPAPTHYFEDKTSGPVQSSLFETDTPRRTMGVREALGLPDIGCDALSPTLRCALTGPRHTTSILSSTAALKVWDQIEVWPNGVSTSRENAQKFIAAKNHYRLSVPEVGVLQGFPEEWSFSMLPAYQGLGLIGNSVAPPVAYNIARSIADVLMKA